LLLIVVVELLLLLKLLLLMIGGGRWWWRWWWWRLLLILGGLQGVLEVVSSGSRVLNEVVRIVVAEIVLLVDWTTVHLSLMVHARRRGRRWIE
jgi:hypothetical protein